MYVAMLCIGAGLNMDEYSLPAEALSSVGSGGGFMVSTSLMSTICLHLDGIPIATNVTGAWSVWLSQSCTLLKSLDGMGCYLAQTFMWP